ncbi:MULTISPECIES: DUF4235 domain-containing protein [Trueperella]|uniref:DUF4235 domain-containing protein n=1 Tax=Trueperella bernardiae TaxID=59561 RepID=A0A0W1KHS2_9ACTO|nr:MULTISPECIES: DUF4235 domain-containing protein [Trueperella]KTF03621.1 hypothetical protein AQZ59_01580 [Trueperella bernardiae]MCM3907884.1 DUF4235 domain-containing protein [Trueperella bernardiae]MDK8600888.1 DUF4235 domain-containing protein [Trueperella bernardiae]MDV6238991.1 DUF4235 domain-containing protein [Trueperella bernardiae]OCW60578.1 hypothetical protein AKG36_02390 [Trueperella bernardiae]
MNIGWKLITVGIAGAAGAASNLVVNQVWEKGLGKQRPTDEAEMMQMPMRDVVVFTAVTAVVSAVVSTALKRKAAEWYGA